MSGTAVVVSALRREFNLDVATVEAGPSGFESTSWIVDRRWFAKVWRDASPSVDLELLGLLADRGLPVPRPLHTEMTRTDDGRCMTVFPYVSGRPSTGEDWAEVARMLRRVHDLEPGGLGLRTLPLSDEPLVQLRPRLDHPWIAARASELAGWLDRFESVLHRAREVEVSLVVSHDDFGGSNVLIDDDGRVAAVLDWDWARLGPREHDLWLVIDEAHPADFLGAYGADDLTLDQVHLEFGLLRRALGDLAARVVGGVDAEGVTTWGFDRLARVDETLMLFR